MGNAKNKVRKVGSSTLLTCFYFVCAYAGSVKGRQALCSRKLGQHGCNFRARRGALRIERAITALQNALLHTILHGIQRPIGYLIAIREPRQAGS